MAFAWLGLGSRLVGFIVAAVNFVEKFVPKKGAEKLEAAEVAILGFVSNVEGEVAERLLLVPEVKEAVKEVVNAVVNLQNKLAKFAAGDPSK